MATTTGLITVAEFENIPDPEGGNYQLQHGELVFVAYPRKAHQAVRLRALGELIRHLAHTGLVSAEFPFWPTSEHNEWACDVGYLFYERWNAIADNQLLRGAPDLVIDVFSPSNRKSQ